MAPKQISRDRFHQHWADAAHVRMETVPAELQLTGANEVDNECADNKTGCKLKHRRSKEKFEMNFHFTSAGDEGSDGPCMRTKMSFPNRSVWSNKSVWSSGLRQCMAGAVLIKVCPGWRLPVRLGCY
jgi:hypothetical protein